MVFLLLLESPQLSLINAENNTPGKPWFQRDHARRNSLGLNLTGIGPRHDERHAFDRGQIDHLGAVPVFTASFNWSAASLIEISGRK
jgi:hypothetical protein